MINKIYKKRLEKLRDFSNLFILFLNNYLFILIKIAIDKKISKTPIAIKIKDKAFEIPKSVLSTPVVVVVFTAVD
jgi:hypothetical protein